MIYAIILYIKIKKLTANHLNPQKISFSVQSCKSPSLKGINRVGVFSHESRVEVAWIND